MLEPRSSQARSCQTSAPRTPAAQVCSRRERAACRARADYRRQRSGIGRARGICYAGRMRAASLTLGLGMCFATLGCAGGKPVVEPGSLTGDRAADSARGEPNPLSADAGSADASVQPNGSAHADESPPPAPVVDPAVAHALVAKSGEGAGATPLGLRFEVMELGAELPWAFAIVNRGTEAA